MKRLIAHGVCDLFSEEALAALTRLLRLPPFPGAPMPAVPPDDAALERLEREGYITRSAGAPPVVAYELAFLLEGVCTSPSALRWAREGVPCLIACRWQGVLIVCRKTPVGKWSIFPCRTERALIRELDESLKRMPAGAVVSVGSARIVTPPENGRDCAALLRA